jgi:predicted SnoaL-like aldol condensation-catalyzing enzyme
MEINMVNTIPEQNKALVLQAFDTLFNKRDYEAAERFWSNTYIQHSAHIEPGREGLFDLIRSAPDTLRYEPGIVLAEGNFVILHGRHRRECRADQQAKCQCEKIDFHGRSLRSSHCRPFGCSS